MTELQRVKQANKDWFSRGNKRLFGDKRYYIYRSPITSRLYLIRSTYQWSDMFGAKRVLSYRVNPINMVTLKIERLLDQSFDSLSEAKAYAKTFDALIPE